MTDVLVIGAGVNGAAIARELSRYDLNIVCVEKALDVCEGTSKANSGIVHAGFDALPGTLKALLNVKGNLMMKKLSEDLDFAFKQNGSIVLCFDEKDMDKLNELKERGEKNGVSDLKIVGRDEVLKMEPNIGDSVVAALIAPTGGIVCPFNLTIALAENACDNGVIFKLGTAVTDIKKIRGGYLVKTDKGDIETKVVVNSAGVFADKIHNMVSEDKIEIEPRKGEYILCDKTVGNFVSHTLFQLPTKYGKGVLATPTVHGNLMFGPTAFDQEDKEGTYTSRDGLNEIVNKASVSVNNLPSRQVITSFAGLRARLVKDCELNNFEDGKKADDFMIGEIKDAPGFIDVAGIESPGLTAAPATGEYVAKLVCKILNPKKKDNFIEKRTGIKSIAQASPEEKHLMIKKNPAYANIICRCETVSEGEILDAIHRTLGATTVDGVKRRTRAGMGRCQSGFCNPKVVEILARELKIDESEVRKSGENSWFVL